MFPPSPRGSLCLPLGSGKPMPSVERRHSAASCPRLTQLEPCPVQRVFLRLLHRVRLLQRVFLRLLHHPVPWRPLGPDLPSLRQRVPPRLLHRRGLRGGWVTPPGEAFWDGTPLPLIPSRRLHQALNVRSFCQRGEGIRRALRALERMPSAGGEPRREGNAETPWESARTTEVLHFPALPCSRSDRLSPRRPEPH